MIFNRAGTATLGDLIFDEGLPPEQASAPVSVSASSGSSNRTGRSGYAPIVASFRPTTNSSRKIPMWAVSRHNRSARA